MGGPRHFTREYACLKGQGLPTQAHQAQITGQVQLDLAPPRHMNGHGNRLKGHPFDLDFSGRHAHGFVAHANTCTRWIAFNQSTVGTATQKGAQKQHEKT